MELDYDGICETAAELTVTLNIVFSVTVVFCPLCFLENADLAVTCAISQSYSIYFESPCLRHNHRQRDCISAAQTIHY